MSIATLEYAEQMDKQDKIKQFRDRFFIPKTIEGEEVIYFCGNSLGLQPKEVSSIIDEELESWRNNAVKGHFQGTKWATMHEEVASLSAPIIGAKKEEIAIMNTLTVNLHLLMVSFYRPTQKRHKVLIESDAFPSDKYAIKSQIKYHGFDPAESLIEVRPKQKGEVLDQELIFDAIAKAGDELALILIGGINYYTGQIFDMEKITRKGHEVGAVVGFDLAHAFANIPLHLHDWDVDFAAWCNYKYANGGPGAIAGIFIHEKHFGKSLPRFEGWWGNRKETRFLMKDDIEPAQGAEGWQISNAPTLSLAPLKGSLKIINEAGMENLRRKSIELTGYLSSLISQIGDERVYVTPTDPNERGCQISIHIKENGKTLFEKISKRGVICDWREPDVIRVAPTPLYNTFREVFNFYRIFKEELETL